MHRPTFALLSFTICVSSLTSSQNAPTPHAPSVDDRARFLGMPSMHRPVQRHPSAPAPAYAFGRADFPVGYVPSSIAKADFNRDGKIDLAVANEGGGTVSILLGRPDGTFAPKVDYPAGVGPNSIAVGDFNNDGIPDIAAVTEELGNTAGSTVEVLLGNGDGTFRPPVSFSTGLTPIFVTAGDFNRDGRVDLAVANLIDNTVSILLGNGDGTFQPHIDYPTGQGPHSVTAADLNGDGILDLVVPGGNTVSVLLGNRNGTFQPHVDYATAYQSIIATVGDFNHDGLVDLAVAANGGLSLLLGNGNGTFQAHTDFALPTFPNSMVAGDFNADGNLDVAIGSRNPAEIVVLSGTSGGGFQLPVLYAASTAALATADFNGDGVLDFAAAGTDGLTGGGSVAILLGDGSGNFNNKRDYPTGVEPVEMATADFNGDGNPDLAVVNQNCPLFPCPPGYVSVLLGNTDGSFNSPVNYTVGVVPWPIGVGDFNNDHNWDLAVGNHSDGTISILPGLGDGTFQGHVDYSSGLNSVPNSLALADFNRDGNLDVAAGTGNGAIGNPALAIMLGAGNGALQGPTLYPTSNSPQSVITADFNKDGIPDLAEINFSTRFVSVWLGNGDATFQTPVNYAVPTTISPLVVTPGDFNGDGNLDLAVVGFDGGGILLGNGDGTFRVGSSLPFGGFYATTGDFNSDGNLDLTLPGWILLGNGDGTFNLRTGPSGNAPVVADFNHDGAADLAELNGLLNIPFFGGVSVYLNNPSVALFPTKLGFQAQGLGVTSSPLTFLVSNPSITPLKISSIATTGDYAQTNNCSAALGPGANCTIRVTFTPTAPGTRFGTVVINDNSPPGTQALGLSGAGYRLAIYDPTLMAPKCAFFDRMCDSGPAVLLGRDNIANGAEPNQPNTIRNSCADGTAGSFHVDESIDRVKIATTDGRTLSQGSIVRLSATVWVANPSQDALDLYYTTNANNPSWTYLTTLIPSVPGSQTLSTLFRLRPGSLQAVRANFRRGGMKSSCSTGAFDDHDDLIFVVR